MNNDNRNMDFTAQDIEKYFSGKLTPRQMHELEKASLDDPFLAEAMEGYEAMNGKEWEKQLALAKIQMAEAAPGAKVIPMRKSTGRWWKAAAAVLVIASGATLTFTLTNKNKPEENITQQIAKVDNNISPATKDNTVLPQKTEPVKLIATTANEEVKKPEGNNFVAQERHDDNFKIKPTQGIMQAADSVSMPANYLTNNDKGNVGTVSPPPPPAPIASDRNRNIAAETVAIKDMKVADADSEILKRKAAGYYAAKSEKATNNFFNAQIVAADNSPLPFSNISVKSGSFETYADVKGNFRLFSSDSLLTVEVKSIGYQPRSFSLRSNQASNKIILLENEQTIKEKMDSQNGDVGLSGKIRRASVLSDSAINVEPKDGWDNYNTYVANNLDIPEEMLKNEFHGEVELSFDVKANGAISNVRINKSLGPAYDEAAKRLIMQGPQWKIKKGRKTSASVKVKF